MPVKIFVGGINVGTPSFAIRQLFEKFGTVVECDVLGTYGFVHMEGEEEASAAILALNGQRVKGSQLQVEKSTSSARQKRYTDGSSGGMPPSRGLPPNRSSVPPRGRMERFHPYDGRPAPPVGHAAGAGASGGAPGEGDDSFAKELLLLYFKDPVAFDAYARDPRVLACLDIPQSELGRGPPPAAAQPAYFDPPQRPHVMAPLEPLGYGSRTLGQELPGYAPRPMGRPAPMMMQPAPRGMPGARSYLF